MRVDRVAKVASVFAVAFAASFLSSSIFAPMNASNATDSVVSANVTARAYTLSLTVSPNVELDLSASLSGAMTVGAAAVSIETNAPTGYKLYMNMTGTNADTSDLVQTDGSNTISSSGTFTDPVALGNGTWGYAIPHAATSVKSTNGFDDSYSTMSSATPNGKKFAAIPTSSQQAQLIAETGTSNSGTPNQFNVYYGVKADYSIVAGTYTNKVLYTGIADAGPTHNMVVFPEETPSIDGGDTLTINTSLFTTASTISANAYILDQSELTAVTASPASISNYSSSQMDCTSSTANGYLELACTNIAKPIGNYFVYVDVPDYGQHYSKAFNYVANFYNITYMQDMTADICNDVKYVTTPSNQVYNGSTFSDSTVHSYPRATYADTGRTVTYKGNTVNTYRPNHLGDTDYVPETTMKDSRQSIFYENGEYVNKQVEYTVRKLADGNCWMTENLALNYEEGREFTSADSNVQTTKTAAHATQSLDGAVQTWEASQSMPGTAGTDDDTCAVASPTDPDYATKLAKRICWWERNQVGVANNGAYSDRWLSRSTNGATETSPNQSEAPTDNLTGENQKFGTYYNWYTSVLGTVTGSDNAKIATEDVCPKGWKLPAYTDNGSWLYLIRDIYGIIVNDGGNQTDNRGNLTLHAFPFSVPYSGYASRSTGTFGDQGRYGVFWSAGAASDIAARYLSFSGVLLNPSYDSYKTSGFSVRCLAKQS